MNVSSESAVTVTGKSFYAKDEDYVGLTIKALRRKLAHEKDEGIKIWDPWVTSADGTTTKVPETYKLVPGDNLKFKRPEGTQVQTSVSFYVTKEFDGSTVEEFQNHIMSMRPKDRLIKEGKPHLVFADGQSLKDPKPLEPKDKVSKGNKIVFRLEPIDEKTVRSKQVAKAEAEEAPNTEPVLEEKTETSLPFEEERKLMSESAVKVKRRKKESTSNRRSDVAGARPASHPKQWNLMSKCGIDEMRMTADGLKLVTVREKSPFDLIGMASGSIVTEINGRPITSEKVFFDILSAKPKEKLVKFLDPLGTPYTESITVDDRIVSSQLKAEKARKEEPVAVSTGKRKPRRMYYCKHEPGKWLGAQWSGHKKQYPNCKPTEVVELKNGNGEPAKEQEAETKKVSRSPKPVRLEKSFKGSKVKVAKPGNVSREVDHVLRAVRDRLSILKNTVVSSERKVAQYSSKRDRLLKRIMVLEEKILQLKNKVDEMTGAIGDHKKTAQKAREELSSLSETITNGVRKQE